jgi:small GTP-binding protein
VEETVPPGSGVVHPTPVDSEADLTGSAELLTVLDTLLSVTGGLLSDGVHRDLLAARGRVAENRCNLVVLGEFKRGKSTLINALLDRDLLPTGVVPLTSVVTALRGGDHDRLVIHFTDGRQEERPVVELAQYVTEAQNPGNQRGVALARVEIDDQLLHAGVELVDTPGIGSIHERNTEVARDFLPHVDAAICVLDAGQPLTKAECELFVEAAQRVPRLLIVLNKIDHLHYADRDVAVRFVASALHGLGGSAAPEVYPVSAREREGLAPLRARLRQLAANERAALVLASVAGLGRGVAADAAQAARFEARAIQLPLDELCSRAREFEQRIADLRAASTDAGDLLERGTDRALGQLVNEPLQDYARRKDAELRAALRERAALLGDRSPRELSADLESWINCTVQTEFEQLVVALEAAIADELTELEHRYAGRVREILEWVQRVAEDVFGARANDVLPETVLLAPSRFSFKLRDAENALDMIVGFGRTIAPGTLGRRLVVRDAEQRLVDMTDRHVGRLRSELADRVSNAARRYRRDLAASVAEAIDAIRDAINRALEERQRGEEHARARLAQLAEVEHCCEQLAVRMERWPLSGQPLRTTNLS